MEFLGRLQVLRAHVTVGTDQQQQNASLQELIEEARQPDSFFDKPLLPQSSELKHRDQFHNWIETLTQYLNDTMGDDYNAKPEAQGPSINTKLIHPIFRVQAHRAPELLRLATQLRSQPRPVGETTRTFVQSLLQQVAAGQLSLTDHAIDWLLFIYSSDVETSLRQSALWIRWGLEKLTYEASPYTQLRAMLTKLNLGPDDIVYDLGAGYGRVVLYTALMSAAQVVGIELVPERAVIAQAAIKRLDLDRASMRVGHVLNEDLRDGTTFFLFNPFRQIVLSRVARQLETIAVAKPIRIISSGPSNKFFSQQGEWLQPPVVLYDGGNMGEDLLLFESKASQTEKNLQAEATNISLSS